MFKKHLFLTVWSTRFFAKKHWFKNFTFCEVCG